MKKNVISEVRKILQISADEKTKSSYERYFKEEVKGYGVKTHLVDKIAKDFLKDIKNLNKKEVLILCEDLFKSGYIEESWIAANWVFSLRKTFLPEDFITFERWVKNYITNWASCDTFCNHTIGEFVSQYPEFIKELKKWAKSKNRWVRRAAAVTLILPVRSGRFLKDVFEISNILLRDLDDLVQKGYGWLLKEASKTHQKEVFNFVVKNKKIMPRTALRYAIEKMPQSLRQKAMMK